ncbi:unnamed protein product [Citrullus colocynthis]|uniref:Uncharacterized protein n=1 Tax=Citrullus colocynthis TaxID=252529 RepID=A0ABP0Y438_9ROSI
MGNCVGKALLTESFTDSTWGGTAPSGRLRFKKRRQLGKDFCDTVPKEAKILKSAGLVAASTRD